MLKLRYKEHTGSASDFDAGTILFDKKLKTIKVGGDLMYPHFTLFANGMYSLSGDLSSFTTIDEEKFKNILNTLNLDSSNVEAIEVYYDSMNNEISFAFIYKDPDTLPLVTEITNTYNNAARAELNYYPDNYPMCYNCSFTNTSTGDTYTDNNSFGYVYVEDFNKLTSFLQEAGASDTTGPFNFTYNYNNNEWDIVDSSSNTYNASSLEELGIKCFFDINDCSYAYFFIDIKTGSDTTIAASVYDNQDNYLGTVYADPSTISSFYNGSITEGELTINGDDNPLYIEVFPQHFGDNNIFEKLSYMLGIDIDNSQISGDGGIDIVANTMDPRDGTVPAPDDHNQILTSDGWSDASSISSGWTIYEDE